MNGLAVAIQGKSAGIDGFRTIGSSTCIVRQAGSISTADLQQRSTSSRGQRERGKEQAQHARQNRGFEADCPTGS